jgi:hypothetical protein
MRRISLAVLILPLLAVDPTLALAMGAGGGGGAGAGGAGAGGSSAGNGAPVDVKRHVIPPATSARPTSDAIKDPLLVQTRTPRSVLLERPGRQ